ncbi:MULTISPECIES: crotonase/enoyl-CoA hydratase family protein [unclassified Roseitalea]|uniref:crotonase/enoyl-CoA hydratase family protein n=1 Tax=unclassified Roseitalea TaxID=2639107 RepID=UPI00273E1AB7|nr:MULTISPECIES: crotonase/enoyl-CoA hydratase family protein [unclassified Roseitalea]
MTETSQTVLVERHGAIRIVRLNRPDKKNAITRAMYIAMERALAEAEADDTVRVHVVLGRPGAFSAGNDIADFLAFAEGGQMGAEVFCLLDRVARLEKPLVSGVDGLAIGIGTTLNLHCDLTFATPAAVFRTPFVDLGLVPEAASSLLAPALMGHQRAFAMLAMGETLSAEQAREAGLVYRIVAAEALEARVLEAAEALAAKPAQALALTKRLLKGDRQAVLDRIALEADHFAERLQSHEARAAFKAFMGRKR